MMYKCFDWQVICLITMNSTGNFNGEGVAFLCFLQDSSEFYGILATKEREHYKLRGRQANISEDMPYHECCLDQQNDLPQFYDINIQAPDSFNVDSEMIINGVMRTGGDNCSLYSQSLHYVTDQLLVDNKADEYIKKYFPHSLLHKHCYICIGDMKLKC